MARTRDLKGIACGIVETFISRNNDVAGYWGIGMFYREALGYSISTMNFDLIECRPQPDGPVSRAVSSYYSAYLASHLGGLSLLGANVTLEFGTFGSCGEPRYCSYGDPFVCIVSLSAATGHTYSATRAGRCAPHSSAERCSI